MVAVDLKGDVMKVPALHAMFYAALAAMKWRQEAMKVQVDDVHMRELRQFSKIAAAPRGVFDPLYAGLAADAARLDIALARRNARR
jgi:ABC-type taurine transport system substrate-binding protein